MADEIKNDGAPAPEGPREVAPEALKPTKPKPRLIADDEDEKRADAARAQRRNFVTLMMSGFFFVLLGGFMRFFFPRVLFEPKTKFKIGTPADYELGVDTRYQARYRIWVVKKTDKLFVLLAKCTHLGCTPDWKEAEAKFKCPCHGSGFTADGINFEGPAPRPLDRCDVSLDAEGQIVVDKLKLYNHTQFDATGASLVV
ncbi:MAG: Rieske 2Fe-2S domain-containing protein [Planctomycetes bacterium]|nr:Rieske 2Fe-2S domain-containing protein [Planctomycetota bacterium]